MREVVWKEEGNNYARGSFDSTDPLTLEEFKAILQVDESVWQALDWGAKRYQMGAKLKTGDLTFDDGRITGNLSYGGLGKENLWSHWARFVRREPIPVYPVVQPVECKLSATNIHVEVAKPGAVGGALLVPDIQFGFSRDLRTGKLTPFHDRRVLSLVLQMASRLQPEVVIFLGDFLDQTMFTDKFVRDPVFYWTTQPAILEAHWFLRVLRLKLPHARIVILEGNHDKRMREMLKKHLAEACELRAADELELPPSMSPQRLLALHKLNVEWVGEYPSDIWLGPLLVLHGNRVSATPGGSAKATVEDTDVNTAFGHVHRIERVSRRVRTFDGWRTVRAFTPGCACHIDGRVPGSKPGDNWQNGLAWVDYTETQFTENIVEIIDGEMLFGQRLWVGRDYTDELCRAYPDWNW